ncbi:pimeloyl-ACP methyl ester carboxylesterase [Microbacteriaceae bacterium SG_E_30_P1]|uniref:Pimeloyl-ACP methyl ester carboxylesterase n=1 Tax=Antiquaquibacter oligotrophicus TaxID=2880260 RepID=A0ABT6KLC8_9MICO|nr:lipase family protein [Antiquaquibacter oligotrophicus]MDH6180664.1 pimeloyl-ACP methyl ester carboxylesterase [Antiquaquibacter oligotrophicus]UDF13608.1 lipase family protein [Antiquaquibacter oligotrophicus]
MPSRPSSLLRAFALGLTVSVLLTGCFWNAERRLEEDVVDELTDAEFYDVPDDTPAGQPGEIVRTKPILSAPLGSLAWRIIYHTTDLAGEDVLASAVLAIPDLPAPDDGYPVVSWGHPTTGAARDCAPSLLFDPFLMMTGIHEFLLAGHAVVATDYPGMAVPGDSSYLIGVTEGNSMLDAVRAARNLDPSIGADVTLWGHSQGGQAALFAAQQAAAGYSPDLTITSVATAAPAADLSQLMTDDLEYMEGVTIASYAFPSYEAAYASRYSKDEIRSVLTDAGASAVDELASLCLLTQGDQLHSLARPLIGSFVSSDPSTTEPWKTMLAENNAGGSPIDVPIFIGQGLADTTVDPTSTESFVESLCAAGESVDYRTYEGISHLLAADASMPHVLSWLRQVESGEAPSTC